MQIYKKMIIHIVIIILIAFFSMLYLYQLRPTIDHQNQYQNIIEKEVVKMMDSYHIPGVQLTFFDHDEISTSTFGYQDLKSQHKITDQTVFRAQSLSKTVTAVLVLKLVESHVLSLDDKLVEILDEDFISQIPDIYHNVTIHQILKHEAYMPLGDFNRMFKINEQMMTLEEALIHDLNQKRPSGGFFYSNVGYNLLEYIINQVDDDGYEMLAKTYLFDPLEMSNTSFTYDEIDQKQLAYGYDQFKQKVDHYKYPELGSGGLLSTSSDYYKFIIALIRGEIIHQSSIDLLLNYDENISLGSYGFAFDGYGYGVFIEKDKDTLTFSHGGQGLGFMAFYHVDLDDQSGYIVMSNSQRTYPLISMLSTTFNDQYDLNQPGIKNIRILMIVFEILIALTLYLTICMIYAMVKEKWISHIISYIGLVAVWGLSTFIILYFMLNHYLFIHVLIPIHFEIWVKALIVLNIFLFMWIVSSIIERHQKDKPLSKKIKTKIALIKRNTMIVGMALKHKNTPWYVKVMFIITIGYALSPIDLIPDFIPMIGYLDDIIILPMLLNLSIKLIPPNVLEAVKSNEAFSKDWYVKKAWIYAIPFISIWIYIVYLILRFIFAM